MSTERLALASLPPNSSGLIYPKKGLKANARSAQALHFRGIARRRQTRQRPDMAPERPCQDARTESRNFSPSRLRRLLSPDSDCAAESTCVEAEPVSAAPRCTAVVLEKSFPLP